MTTLHISEVAEQTGFSPATLRYYEEIGVVPAAGRSPGGYREYDERSLGRLAFVARAKQLGLSLEEIRDLARLWDGDECGPVQQRLADFVAGNLAGTQVRVAELVALAGRLQAVAAHLAEDPEAGSCHEACACNVDTVADLADSCTLPAAELPDRIAEWWSLVARATGRQRIDGGVQLRFANEAGLAATIAELAQSEQACCAFFSFTVGIGAEGITLDVRAPIDVEAVADGLFRVATLSGALLAGTRISTGSATSAAPDGIIVAPAGELSTGL